MSRLLTPEKEAAFLEALAGTCNVSEACKVAGVSRVHAYHLRAEYPAFAERWDKAKQIGVEALEDEARRRAFHGTDEPVFYQGQYVDSVKRYSDTLMIFLLKGAKPDVYKDRVASELSGGLKHEVTLTDDEAVAELAALQAQLAAKLDGGDDLA